MKKTKKKKTKTIRGAGALFFALLHEMEHGLAEKIQNSFHLHDVTFEMVKNG